MSDSIPTWRLHPSGRATKLSIADVQVGSAGTPFKINDAFFFGRTRLV